MHIHVHVHVTYLAWPTSMQLPALAQHTDICAHAHIHVLTYAARVCTRNVQTYMKSTVKDTSLLQTIYCGPAVSVIQRFHNILQDWKVISDKRSIKEPGCWPQINKMPLILTSCKDQQRAIELPVEILHDTHTHTHIHTKWENGLGTANNVVMPPSR